jgi:hypothetical protein
MEKKIKYVDLNNVEKMVFNNLDYVLATLKEKQGNKAFKKVLNLLWSKYG